MSKTTTAMRALPFQIKLSEGIKGPESIPQKVQLMRTCKFKHPKYGIVEITRQLFSEMVKNFKAGVRGIELMIDYSHKSNEEAAGWIKDLEIVDNKELGESELWAIPDWTSVGANSIVDKEFAYLSADFDPSYEDPETSVKYGAVLLGAGLTNRPVIKHMNSIIQLSELNKESTMTEEEIKAAEVKFGQIEKLMTDLGVSSVEELMSKIAEMKTQNTDLSEAKQLSEKKVKTDALFAAGKLTKAQVDKALTLKKEAFDSFIELAEMNEGIKLSETGHGQGAGKVKEKFKGDPQDKVLELAEAKQKASGVSFTEAVNIVLSENPTLKAAYEGEEGVEVELDDE